MFRKKLSSKRKNLIGGGGQKKREKETLQYLVVKLGIITQKKRGPDGQGV